MAYDTKEKRKINDASLKQFPLFQRKFLTESDVLDDLLSIDSELRESYGIYQELLEAFDAKDPSGFLS
ncbi:hypothetical protein ACIL82_10815 [Enterococcus faecium]